jgi:tRNA (cmo5U34)-methyltransferase
MNKSTVEEIRRRFDDDVERFSNLESGQVASPDSPLCMDLVTEAAAIVTPHATAMLDVGCGAGNYTLKLLERLPGLDVTLMDLSRPMLDRAVERIGGGTMVQADVREAIFNDGSFDVILAAQVLHHLRGDDEWRETFAKLHRWLRPGGSVWIVDQVEQVNATLQALTRRRYGVRLVEIGGEAYRDEVVSYIDKEDTPRPLVWQLDRLREAGFATVDVLHKNITTAAFGAIR